MPGNAQLPKEAKKVIEKLQEVPRSNHRLSAAAGDWTVSGNTSDELSRIAEFQAQRPFAVRPDVTADVHIVAYESFSTDGTADNQETFNLSNNIIDAVAVSEALVLYEGGTRVEEDSIDFSADSFDFTSSGTNTTLHAYYVVADQALVDIRKVAPRNNWETMKELDAGIANRRDQREDPVTFDFDHPLQAIVPTDWTLEVHIDAPYTVQWEDDTDSDATADNLLLDVPIARARDEIPDLGDVVAKTV